MTVSYMYKTYYYALTHITLSVLLPYNFLIKNLGVGVGEMAQQFLLKTRIQFSAHISGGSHQIQGI